MKTGIVDGVIFDVHGEALVGRIEAGSFRHCPAPQHSVVLQSEIPVQLAGVMLLHDEARGRAGL